jgi:hypothetical protein
LTEQKPIAPRKNRRKGPDWLLHSLSLLSIAGWVAFVIALGITHLAKPEFNSGLVRFHEISIRECWDPALTSQLLYLLWWCCGISLLSLLVNIARLRRASDRMRYNVFVLLSMSAALLAYLSQAVVLCMMG